MSVPVIIEGYNPAWPSRYEAERERILRAIGPWVAAIEHIGSTSVPGLGAKPIIDIMAAVRSLDDAMQCVEPLSALGYQYHPEFEDSLPERRYFNRGPRNDRYHLHMVELTGGFWERHLLFRDYLRAHTEAAREYERLKRDLAARYHEDRSAYTDAKAEFVRSIEEKARAM
jgi:GrpB-like predicted nucleotidyltransferase (UPF0157 family)